MEPRAIRQAILDGLEAASVLGFGLVGQRDRYLAGELDYTLAELELDSLARMEICIAIEIGTGVSLAPEELDRYETLSALAEDVRRRCDA